ncbi:MAG: DUF928 domain-containing protein [Cyanobacteria bacterium P01_E01_bin.6]
MNITLASLNHRSIAIGLLTFGLSWMSWLPGIAQALPDFSGTGRSGNRVGGASRSGGCARITDSHMMPIVPIEADHGGQTTQAQPTFWVYVPYTLDENSPVTFAIHDEHGNDIYQTTFTTAAMPGVYGMQLPDSVELENGSYYDWYLLVYCNDPLRQEVPSFASGWVQRVELPDSIDAGMIDEMTPMDQSRLFASELLWYDALEPLGEVLQDNPDDANIVAEWMDLLELPSVQLNEFSRFPVVPCCDISAENDE